MIRKIIFFVCIFSMAYIMCDIMLSCTQFQTKINAAQKEYPNCVITPSVDILRRQGYEVTIEDTLNNKMYAVSFYFNSCKIYDVIPVK